MVLITSCSNYCSHYLCLSCGAAAHVQVVQNHTEEILEKMNCKEIVSKLRTLALIPENVENDILHSKSKEDANAHLLKHLKEEADDEVVREVLRIAFEEEGYGRMNTFAAFMLRKLQRGLYWCVHYTHAVVVYLSTRHVVYVNKQ